jgi:hypothetical protein
VLCDLHFAGSPVRRFTGLSVNQFFRFSSSPVPRLDGSPVPRFLHRLSVIEPPATPNLGISPELIVNVQALAAVVDGGACEEGERLRG